MEDSVNPKYQLKRIKDTNIRPASVVAGYSSIMSSLLITGASDRTVRFLTATDGKQLKVCNGHRRSVVSIAVSEMGFNGEDPVVVSGSRDGSIILWDPENDYAGESLQMPVEEIRCLSVYQGSVTYLLVGSREGTVILWDLDIDEVVCKFKGHSGCVHCVAITACLPDDADKESDVEHLCIASGGADRSVRLWDVEKPNRRRKKLKHDRSVGTIAIASKGIRPLLACGTSNFMITIWDYDSGLQIRTICGHLGPVNSLVFWESHEVLLISASCDRTVRIFDALTGENVCICLGHEKDVRSVAIVRGPSPMIASCSMDATLRLWDLDNIIKHFYRSETGELGARNDNPPYVPEVHYGQSFLPSQKEQEKISRDEEEATKIRGEKVKLVKERIRMKQKMQQLQHKQTQPNQSPSTNTPILNTEHPGRDQNIRDTPLTPPGNKKNKYMNGNQILHTHNENDGNEAGDELDTKSKRQVNNVMLAHTSPSTTKLSTTSFPPLLNTMHSFSSSSSSLSSPNFVTKEVGSESPSDATNRSGSAIPPKVPPPLFRTLSLKQRVTANSFQPSLSQKNVFGSEPSGSASSGVYTSKDVNRTVERFSIAEVNMELYSAKMKELASEKLHKRLSEKRRLIRRGSRRMSDSTNFDDPNEEDLDPEYKEIEAKKAELIREHKLQEARVKDALQMSQKRSSEALKKRLEEVQKNKIMTMTISDDEETSEEEDDEDGEGGDEIVDDFFDEELLDRLIEAPLDFGKGLDKKTEFRRMSSEIACKSRSGSITTIAGLRVWSSRDMFFISDDEDER